MIEKSPNYVIIELLMKGLIIMYKPPFIISNFMLSMTISIAEKLGKIETYNSVA